MTKIIRNNKKGSVQFRDTQYTISSPLALTANVKADLTNNKGNVLVLEHIAGVTDWLSNTGVITPPDGRGSNYLGRLTLIAVPTQNDKTITIELDIGGSQAVIWRKSIPLKKGGGAENPISEVIPYYTLGTFLQNGGTIKISCDGAANVYDYIFWISRYIKK